jgi:hypothetical protein
MECKQIHRNSCGTARVPRTHQLIIDAEIAGELRIKTMSSKFALMCAAR